MKKVSAIIWGLGCVLATASQAQQSSPPTTAALPQPATMARGDRYQPMIRTEIMRPDRDNPRSIEIYNHMIRFGGCAVSSSSSRVAEMLAMEPNSNGEKHDLGRLLSQFGGCGPSVMINILTLERGVLSEALYKAHAPSTIVPEKITATSDDSTAFLDGEAKWNKMRFSSDKSMIDATNCLVAVQPGFADAVLRTRHGSTEEEGAMDKLFAEAPTCAGPARPKNVSRSFLRAFIADSLYRLSVSDLNSKFLPGIASS
jgi:hypothetical protein